MAIGAGRRRGGSQEVGGVGDCNVLIHAVRLLGGDVNEPGMTKTDSLYIEAPGISRRPLLSSGAMKSDRLKSKLSERDGVVAVEDKAIQ